MPRRVKDEEGFAEAYGSYVQWMSEPDREDQLERQRDRLSGAATRMLDIAELEDQTTRTGGKFAAVRYEDLGLTSHDPGARGLVPGIYTSAGFEGLFGRLVTAVARTGSVPPGRIKQLERTYVERYDRAWRRFLLDTPRQPREDIQVRKSPYLTLLEKADENTRVDLPRESDTPHWIKMIREIRRTLPFGKLADPGDEVDEEEESSWSRYVPFGGSSEDDEEGEGEDDRPPWTEYEARLDVVAVDVEDAASDSEQALLLARDVAEGKPNSFEDAMKTIRRIVPRRGDASMTAALRGILERPVLDGFSAVLASARRELDRRWDERIASRFRGYMTERDLQTLYEPGNGELDAFRATELAPFQRDNKPKNIIGDRAMYFGPLFLRWMGNADELQRMLFSGTGGSGGIALRLKGIPSTIQGGVGMRVLRRDLRLVCPDGDQTFAYREGSGAMTFNWDSSCQELTLRIVMGGEGGKKQEIRKKWEGPLALPRFLQQATRAGSHVLEWTFDGKSGERVLVKYRVASGEEILRIVHQTPPASLGS
jgi:type VI protein secretion system component VasK